MVPQLTWGLLLHPFHFPDQDLQLAAAVASGELRNKGGAVVDALFKSVMLKISRDCEFRPNSSKYFSSEMAADLVFTLGRGSSLKELLRLFGVNPRIVPKFDLQDPRIPHPYVSRLWH